MPIFFFISLYLLFLHSHYLSLTHLAHTHSQMKMKSSYIQIDNIYSKWIISNYSSERLLKCSSCEYKCSCVQPAVTTSDHLLKVICKDRFLFLSVNYNQKPSTFFGSELLRNRNEGTSILLLQTFLNGNIDSVKDYLSGLCKKIYFTDFINFPTCFLRGSVVGKINQK